MLVRLREWWNRPDPMTAIILWQIDQTMEWVNKWHDTRKWSRLWKRAAKKHWVLSNKKWWVLYEAQADADRRLELLGRCASVIDAYSPNHPLLEDIEKELADAEKES